METKIILITFLIMLAILLYYWRLHRYAQSIASILTILGILGTFVGITYALYHFDPKNIENSIPDLLAGLKIAFVTSIGGIFFSIILKLRAANQWRKADKAGDQLVSEATIDDLADHLKAIERALMGDGESTVLTQLQKLRTTFVDKQDALLKSFEDFAEKMAENNSKALIEALREVIKDFNAKISEQFGDNFKQLNQAVERILVWQEKYRQQMDELARQFQVTAQGIESSRKSLSIIAQQSEKIGVNANRLEPILSSIEESQKYLSEHLSAFNDMGKSAREAFPIIQGRLNELTNDFSRYVKEAISESNRSVANLQKSIQEQAERLESTAQTTNRNIETVMARAGQNIDNLFQDSSQRIENQLVNLDKQLSEELTKSLGSLGSQLASLSSKFVEDYTPLTQKLREVVQFARSASNV